MSSVSPTWSPCPCVSTIWVTPLIAAALSETKAGLPVKNGSIRIACRVKSKRKAEWPYQVICMMDLQACGMVDVLNHSHADDCRKARLSLMSHCAPTHANG